MGFGRDISRYAERKRVVKDKNFGPLVSTDMTRCIHCTRCVRFTQDIEGFQQLGTVGRGESTEIGTYIERSVDHELSANIIDLCPVGALNNKPYRYRARAWEMTQHPLVSPHDSVGANLYAHVLRGRVMRIVPRAERGRERNVDRRPRPLQLPRYLRRRSPDEADVARPAASGKRPIGKRRSRGQPSRCAASFDSTRRRRSARLHRPFDAGRALSVLASHPRPRQREPRSSTTAHRFSGRSQRSARIPRSAVRSPSWSRQVLSSSSAPTCVRKCR